MNLMIDDDTALMLELLKTEKFSINEIKSSVEENASLWKELFRKPGFIERLKKTPDPFKKKCILLYFQNNVYLKDKIGKVLECYNVAQKEVKRLEEKYMLVQEEIVRNLVNIGEPVFPEFIDVILNASEDMAERIFTLLIELREKSVHLLINMLDLKNRKVRENAKNALIKIGTPSVLPLLNNIEEDMYLRIEILGKIGDKRALEKLKKIIQNQNYSKDILRITEYAIEEIDSEKAEKILKEYREEISKERRNEYKEYAEKKREELMK